MGCRESVYTIEMVIGPLGVPWSPAEQNSGDVDNGYPVCSLGVYTLLCESYVSH